MNDAPTTSAGKLAAMLDYGWTLCGLASFFNIEVKEVERLIVEHVRRDREEGMRPERAEETVAIGNGWSATGESFL